MSKAACPVEATGPGDIETLAKGGRTNVFGFLLRLAARLPFLFIAGRWYGADALGRFAYATIIVEFAAQLATIGLKRGLAQQLSKTHRPHVHVVWDGLLVGWLTSLAAVILLMALPELMFPNSTINQRDYLLPLTIFGWAGSDIALAALAYRGDIGATVKARSLIEPWTISIAAFGLSWYSKRDGLILAYALSAIAALGASLWPLLRSYGAPRGWRPEPLRLYHIATRNLPLAGADAIEWGSRRLDIAMLGLFFSPAIVGIYYVAQQVASLPQKLKTSFDPILGPVITQNLEEGNLTAVAKQVRQVGFWIIAAQVGIALALSIPGKAVMGLVGPTFVGGTGALAVLLAAEAIAATAVVSEAALIYVAPKRNLAISVAMIAIQAMLSVLFVYAMRGLLPQIVAWGWVNPRPDFHDDAIAAAGPAVALMIALALASVAKAWLLKRLLGASVSGWRWSLVLAAMVAGLAGWAVTRLPHQLEWVELAIGVPLILGIYGAVVWYRGFNTDDRALFRFEPARA
ncbi:lipopolysaccharide biosynthesis protein [Sphingomonas nostoxanthinifaciens]|uniref:lipopolysaccharide biosynthesis protein n=1 Tax=Sphingomonas nostoxanthinifaciens TaxID=2872652 RepID=UPI001CC21EC5|nr:oligosaccharide flippase family protein [Sphingomonas nostoxanthinifaciens]UAK25414.1 oligosaccharide flippase family protein [Sphingomonas nostoxanthinifaciens]